MTQPTPFDPNQVPITVTLSAPQVSMILRGLGKLPLEEVEQLHAGLRNVAVQTLQQAEAAVKAAEEKAAEEKAAAEAAPKVEPAADAA